MLFSISFHCTDLKMVLINPGLWIGKEEWNVWLNVKISHELVGAD